MGVEPTAARLARPATSFEDWEPHRELNTSLYGNLLILPKY